MTTPIGQPFPRLDSPFVEPNWDDPGAGRFISIPWQRLLITLWQFAGGGVAGLAVEQTLGTNPFTFTATQSGTLIIGPPGNLALSRDNGLNFYQANQGDSGGTCGVLRNDQVNVSWSGGTPPVVVFFPDH